MSDARDRILDSAETRLLAKGPAGLVLDQIAADAKVSKGGLLYHFGTKEALVEGLCTRMLERFDRRLEELCEAEGGGPGAWARAYLASTVAADGRPADDSAQLMAGILATLGRDSTHLDAVRAHFSRWHERLESDGIDPRTATLVRLAADGLWLSSLLGLQQLDPNAGHGIVEALRAMTKEQEPSP